jgi:hypothetical protein
MNISLSSLFLSVLLSGCEVLELASYFYIDTMHSITSDNINLRGSCANLSKGQIAVRIVEIDGRTTSFDIPNIGFTNDWAIELSEGQHAIGIRLGHTSKIQTLILRFSPKHRYRLSATFNSDAKKFDTHFWDETEFPSKKLSSFEFEGSPDESGLGKSGQDICH